MYLLRPVLHGMCRYAELKDGSLSLDDVCLMNLALDVREENERRAYESAKRNAT
jgi:hypothetical protein